ncbi:MAG: iron-sulfur cluster assembly scaffold protein [Candidatus Diapherotrites archaeon]|nr:iron-sulfur cluster assembly scaffold protein [Candidatus Diapherotrites archaeon]
MGTSFKYEKKEKTHSWFDEDYFYTPLACVESIEYDGEVENLEVDDSHSFATDSFCVHNCGDVMYLYINVRDNKIVDIGFETMGCAAAIATSSMITEMAKGKTLEEAEGITRADVSKALMGLPPIKEHCSNLAADALQEAIKDYKKKQGIE